MILSSAYSGIRFLGDLNLLSLFLLALTQDDWFSYVFVNYFGLIFDCGENPMGAKWRILSSREDLCDHPGPTRINILTVTSQITCVIWSQAQDACGGRSMAKVFLWETICLLYFSPRTKTRTDRFSSLCCRAELSGHSFPLVVSLLGLGGTSVQFPSAKVLSSDISMVEL